MKSTVLLPGDFGVLLRADGSVDVLLPPGYPGMTSERDRALLGAAVGVTTDEDFRAYALGTLDLYQNAQGGPSQGAH